MSVLGAVAISGIFVVNSIINDAVVKKTKPADLAIMDYKKAFDILSPKRQCTEYYS